MKKAAGRAIVFSRDEDAAGPGVAFLGLAGSQRHQFGWAGLAGGVGRVTLAVRCAPHLPVHLVLVFPPFKSFYKRRRGRDEALDSVVFVFD